MMAGFIIRVLTVTYDPQHARRSDHVPPHHVRERGPLMSDAMLKHSDPLPAPTPGFTSGFCGTRIRPGTGCAWARLISDLQDYAERWGTNPLDLKYRIGVGAKEGKRGRGPQDYLFNRKGAGDGND